MDSLAIYDLVAEALRGRIPGSDVRRRALAAPPGLWARVLGLEGCAVQFDRAARASGVSRELPDPLRAVLRDASSTALGRALLVHEQIPEIAALAATNGIRVLALKGAARLLGGELAGTRSISDIDLLVSPTDADRFHLLLQRETGYRASGPRYAHHLSGLTRPRSLGVEVHFRLSDVPLALDADIWWETRRIRVGAHEIEIPSPTEMLLHTLEHAIGVNWTSRYRLRDIVDVAALFGPGVSVEAVRAHVDHSGMRAAHATLLGAAREINPSIPWSDATARRTVRRIARARLAVATLPRGKVVAERVYRYAGLVAEGSPRGLVRAGWGLVRRLRAATLAAIPLLFGGCLESTAPPRELPPPAFIFVSDADGTRGIYRHEAGVATRLSVVDQEDAQPHSAAGKIVFTSWRDANAEIYIADLALGSQQRLTIGGAFDGEAALDPSGTTIAFVSGRSGAPRIWLMDANGANPRPLETGSATLVPEVAPAWSPSGDRIAFTLTRTGTSQVFIAPASGGAAEQLSHESGGAFTPSWASGGASVVYMAVAGGPRLAVISATGATLAPFAQSDDGLSEPTCSGAACLAVSGALGAPGDIVYIRRAGREPELLTMSAADERRPVIIVPQEGAPAG